VFMTDSRDGSRANSLPLVPHGVSDAVPFVPCGRCHMLNSGTSKRITPGAQLTETQGIKVPQLRNLLEKTGFDKNSLANNRGFGFGHDGSFATIDEFLHFDVFDFEKIPDGETKRRDIISFLMSFNTDTHAGVGYQITLDGGNKTDPATLAQLDLMRSLADAKQVGLVVHGRVGGVDRGYAYLGNGVFQSDKAGQQIDATALRN